MPKASIDTDVPEKRLRLESAGGRLGGDGEEWNGCMKELEAHCPWEGLRKRV